MGFKEIFSKEMLVKIVTISPERIIIPILYKISPVSAVKWLYKRRKKEKLDLERPQNFNQKIQWLKLFEDNELKTRCADKYLVREYLKKNGCEEILVELLDVYDDPSQIKFEKLPNKFAMKCNHGCAMNIICFDKQKLDINKTKKKFRKWLKTQQAFYSIEPQYAEIPRKIICEAFIDDGTGNLPIDYKVYCFNGEPLYILTCTERSKILKLSIYDTHWNKKDYINAQHESNTILKRPKNLERMLEYSRKLSTPFSFVRIDFFDCGERLYFGEMTFTPLGGLVNYYTDESNKYLGDLIKLPKK